MRTPVPMASARPRVGAGDAEHEGQLYLPCTPSYVASLPPCWGLFHGAHCRRRSSISQNLPSSRCHIWTLVARSGVHRLISDNGAKPVLGAALFIVKEHTQGPVSMNTAAQKSKCLC